MKSPKHLTCINIIRFFRLLFAGAALALPLTANAITSTEIDNLTSVSSTTVKNGLGFNMINLGNQWEFQMAAAAGSKEARWGPGWNNVENMSKVFNMGTTYTNDLNWCSTYGLSPMLIAAFGPPYQSLGTFTTAQAYASGVTSIKLNQSVASIIPPYCQVMRTGNSQLVPQGKCSYAGALIDSVNTSTNTITLATATNVALTSGQTLIINKLLYPSCATSASTDPSVVAYGGYAEYLSSQIAAHGLTGNVELWNEPPWANDPWDHRPAYYTTVPPGITATSPNFGFAEYLAPTIASTGTHYCWGGSNKSGSRSVLSSYMSPALTATEVAQSMGSEAWHSYGNSPEDSLWDPTLLAASGFHDIWKTILPGGNLFSDLDTGRLFNLMAPTLGFTQCVTETGLYTNDNVRKARFNMRGYLGFLADGATRVDFYCFAVANASTAPTYGFVDATTQAPTQAYTAIQGLVMTDMGNLPVAPLAYTSANLPTVPSYSGTYPLATMSIVGRQTASDTANTIDFVAWQRSMSPPGPTTNLAVTSVTNKVNFKFNNNSFAPTMELWRGTVSGGPYPTPVQPNITLDTVTATDSAVTYGTTYYYITVGTNPAGISSNSNEVSATPVATGSGTFNNNSKPAGPAQVAWTTISPPAAANITVQLPTGYTATAAWDLVTRASVAITPVGSTVTYPVSDNPVCLNVVPTPTLTSFVTNTPSGTLRNDFGGQDGCEFTVGSSPVTVQTLGRWVVAGNTGSHLVQLVRASDLAVLGSATVNTSGATAGAFAYVPITPVTLPANTSYYLMVDETAGGDQWYSDGILTTTSVGTINQSEYYASGYNGATIGSYCFGPVSFQY